MPRKKIFASAIILTVLAINIFFALPRLEKYSSVDEPYWTYDRTPDFWKAVAKHKWKNTDINDKPGVTVAEISGLGLLSGVDPLSHKAIRQEPKSIGEATEMIRINFFLRLPIYLTCLIFLGVFYFLLQKLFHRAVAIFSLIFLGLSPIILGVSLIINPDSLLWGFLPLSILSYLVYQKENASPKSVRRIRYLLTAGFFLGLALLTKYVANILFVYLLGLLFLNYVYLHQSQEDFLSYVKKALLDYGILILVSLLTFFVLYPATWINPKMLLEGTLLSAAFESTWPIFVIFFGLLLLDIFALKANITSFIMNFFIKYRAYLKFTIGGIFLIGIIFVLFNVYSDLKIFDFEGEMASPKGDNVLSLLQLARLVTTDIYGLIFGLTPLAFLFFLWGLGKNTLGRDEIRTEAAVVSYFSIFILLYYFASTVNQVTATVRYQIVIYPLACIIAGIGLHQFLGAKKIQKYTQTYLVYPLILIISTSSLYLSAPHFFNYSSALLPYNYILNLKDMGDGSFEAARFLNALPNAQDLSIWSDKGAVCETFVGKCKVSFNKNDTAGNFDYFVLSAGRKSRSLKLELSADFEPAIDFPKAYADNFSEAELQINFNKNPRNFVRVVKTEKILER